MKQFNRFQSDFVASMVSDHSQCLKNIIPGGKLNVESALQVYRNGYFARLTEALGETYEACWWVLGDERFFEICKDFIKGHPSKVDNLSHYGFEFPEFLKTINEFSNFPFLVDLANFELKFTRLFHQKEGDSLPPQKIVELIEGHTDFKMELNSNYFIFESSFSIYNIWKQRKITLDDHSKVGQPEESIIPDWNTPQIILATKTSDLIKVTEISQRQKHLMELLCLGRSIGDAVISLNEAEDKIESNEIQKLFQIISSEGLLKDINPNIH